MSYMGYLALYYEHYFENYDKNYWELDKRVEPCLVGFKSSEEMLDFIKFLEDNGYTCYSHDTRFNALLVNPKFKRCGAIPAPCNFGVPRTVEQFKKRYFRPRKKKNKTN